MATKKSNTTRTTTRKAPTKAMLEKSLSSAMGEMEALSLNLAKEKETRDMLAGQLETATESHMAEIARLQEKILFLTAQVESKQNLIDYIKTLLSNFSTEWKDLRGKPWKRFWRAVALLSDFMDIVTIIIQKINDEPDWSDEDLYL
jgi:chromosome segregation ATPase